MRQACLVLINCTGFDNRIFSTLGNQYRFADPGQKIVIVENARE